MSQIPGLMLGLSALLIVGSPAAHAIYPEKPVRMIVPFVPGGATDAIGRIIQPAMADLLKQQVVVDNRGGAAGNIGVEVTVRASPDGYTFLLGNVGAIAINPVLYVNFPYRPLKDLIPVTLVADVPGCLVTHPTLPVKNVKELIAHISANPGKLNYGAPSASAPNTLEMVMLLNATGTRAVQIAYKGGGPAMIGLLSNEVQWMFTTFSSAVNYAKQNRIRMLAVVSPERNPVLPEIPTMREQGFNMTAGAWHGVFVPKGTPQSVVGKLYKISVDMMKDAQVIKRLDESGITIVTSKSPADFTAFVNAETERFGKVIKDSGIKPD